jgi:hypothetical protein
VGQLAFLQLGGLVSVVLIIGLTAAPAGITARRVWK